MDKCTHLFGHESIPYPNGLAGQLLRTTEFFEHGSAQSGMASRGNTSGNIPLLLQNVRGAEELLNLPCKGLLSSGSLSN